MIKHLKPREFPENFNSLFNILSKKSACVCEANFDEACMWREMEINYIQKKYGINVFGKSFCDYYDEINRLECNENLTNS